MKKSLVLLALVGMVLIACSTSFATTYVVTNDDNCTTASNTSSIYTLNTSTGALKLAKTIQTGGIGGCGGYFSNYDASLTKNHKCLYLFDVGTGAGDTDIAAFATPGPVKVGNYKNASVQAAPGLGGSIALAPNGKFLYAVYTSSGNVGAWKVNADCSLTFIAAYTASVGADAYSSLKVTPNSGGLLVSAIDFSAVELFTINQTSGALHDVGFASLGGFPDCGSIGCFPEAIDITKDNKVAILGNASVATPAVFTVNITKTGLKGAALWELPNGPDVDNLSVPWLSDAAYQTGTGNLFISGTGFAGGVPGVITANFSETSGISVKNVTQVTPAGSGAIDGEIQTTGNVMVIAEWFNALQTFKINSDGSITPSAQGAVIDNNADGGLSFFIFPTTR